MSIGEFWEGALVELPSSFSSQDSINNNLQIDLALQPFESQDSISVTLVADVDIECGIFSSESSLSIGEIFAGAQVSTNIFTSIDSLLADASLAIEAAFSTTSSLSNNIDISLACGSFTTVSWGIINKETVEK